MNYSRRGALLVHTNNTPKQAANFFLILFYFLIWVTPTVSREANYSELPFKRRALQVPTIIRIIIFKELCCCVNEHIHLDKRFR